MVTPAFLPSARIACSERCRCGPASTWTVMMSAPALAKASRCGSTGAIIRCTSSVFWRDRADRLHHVGPEGDDRHEMPVHHVEVDPVGAGGLDRADLLGELGEVGRQDRRRDAERAGHEASLLPFEVTRGGKAGNAAGGLVSVDPVKFAQRPAQPEISCAAPSAGGFSGIYAGFRVGERLARSMLGVDCVFSRGVPCRYRLLVQSHSHAYLQ